MVLSCVPMLAAPTLDRLVETGRRELNRLMHLPGNCVPRRAPRDLVAHGAPRMRGMENAVRAVGIRSAQRVLEEVVVETFGVLVDLAEMPPGPNKMDTKPMAVRRNAADAERIMRKIADVGGPHAQKGSQRCIDTALVEEGQPKWVVEASAKRMYRWWPRAACTSPTRSELPEMRMATQSLSGDGGLTLLLGLRSMDGRPGTDITQTRYLDAFWDAAPGMPTTTSVVGACERVVR